MKYITDRCRDIYQRICVLESVRSIRHAAWMKTSVRWLMVFALVYYVSPWQSTSAGTVAGASGADLYPKMPVEESELGMGGMAYFENLVPGVSIEPASLEFLEGISEPESFSRVDLLLFTSYTVQPNDTILNISQRFALNQDTIISVNGITNARALRIGQVLRIPNQDGLAYNIRKGDTLESIAEKHNTSVHAIKAANELFSNKVNYNTAIFIPGARLDLIELQEITGDLFIWPTSRGPITSAYGYRASPFTGVRQFHNGIDIGVPTGTPIRAAMAGRVTTAAFDRSYGNFIVITHHSGYRTLYAHMSMLRVSPGAYVSTGELIGLAGSTGMSTGPHLHFTVYRHGVTVNPINLMR